MACAILAPIDAVKTLANEIKNIAGIYMKPRAKGGKPSSFKPIVIKDNEPKKAIGIPHAAAVPIDVFISIPLYLKKGTVKLPPPMPSTEEADPIPTPVSIETILLVLFFTFLFRLNIICMAIRKAKIPIIFLNISPFSELAINAPRMAPNEIPIAIGRNAFASIEPFR